MSETELQELKEKEKIVNKLEKCIREKIGKDDAENQTEFQQLLKEKHKIILEMKDRISEEIRIEEILKITEIGEKERAEREERERAEKEEREVTEREEREGAEKEERERAEKEEREREGRAAKVKDEITEEDLELAQRVLKHINVDITKKDLIDNLYVKVMSYNLEGTFDDCNNCEKNIEEKINLQNPDVLIIQNNRMNGTTSQKRYQLEGLNDIDLVYTEGTSDFYVKKTRFKYLKNQEGFFVKIFNGFGKIRFTSKVIQGVSNIDLKELDNVNYPSVIVLNAKEDLQSGLDKYKDEVQSTSITCCINQEGKSDGRGPYDAIVFNKYLKSDEWFQSNLDEYYKPDTLKSTSSHLPIVVNFKVNEYEYFKDNLKFVNRLGPSAPDILPKSNSVPKTQQNLLKFVTPLKKETATNPAVENSLSNLLGIQTPNNEPSQTLRVMSYNLHKPKPFDDCGENYDNKCKRNIETIIKQYDPDVLIIQKNKEYRELNLEGLTMVKEEGPANESGPSSSFYVNMKKNTFTYSSTQAMEGIYIILGQESIRFFSRIDQQRLQLDSNVESSFPIVIAYNSKQDIPENSFNGYNIKREACCMNKDGKIELVRNKNQHLDALLISPEIDFVENNDMKPNFRELKPSTTHLPVFAIIKLNGKKRRVETEFYDTLPESKRFTGPMSKGAQQILEKSRATVKKTK